jgi:hypothetical protein
MNYTNFLKRAWHILWHYPALWVFGFLLALTGSSSGGGGGGGQGSVNYRGNQTDFDKLPDTEFFRQIGDYLKNLSVRFENIQFTDVLPWIILGGFAILVLSIAFTILRNLALTANYKMVNHYEATGEKVNWKQGFRWGWSKKIWQLFLIDLVVGLPVAAIVIILFGCAALPFLLAISENNAATAVGIVAGIALLLLAILILVIISVFVGVWLKLAKRICVLDDKGIMDSLRSGWKLMRGFWKDVLILWLIMVGVQLGFGLVMIPVVLILLVLSGLLGGGIGFAIWAISQGAITAIIIGFILFILFVSIPSTFAGGLGETYFETVWTLFFRETQLPHDAADLSDLPGDEPQLVEPAIA